VVLDPVLERQLAGATKAKSRDRAVSIRLALKAGKCLCIDACPSEVLYRIFALVVEIRLSDLQSIAIDEIDLLALKQVGLAHQLAKRAKVIATGSINREACAQGHQGFSSRASSD
jgi:ribosomal protein L15